MSVATNGLTEAARPSNAKSIAAAPPGAPRQSPLQETERRHARTATEALRIGRSKAPVRRYAKAETVLVQ
jgi:hypothetical protein